MVEDSIPQASIVETLEWDEIWRRHRGTINRIARALTRGLTAEELQRRRRASDERCKPRRMLEKQKQKEEREKRLCGPRSKKFRPVPLRG